MSEISLSSGVMLERVGEDIVVLVPGSASVKLSGEAARYVESLNSGEKAEASVATVNSLVSAGVVQAGRGWSRRSVVKGGAVALGAGVMTLALPSIAAASSNPTALMGTWYWSNDYFYDQDLDPQEQLGLQNPSWIRVFFIELPEGFVLSSTEPSAVLVGREQFAHVSLFSSEENRELAPGEEGLLLFLNELTADDASAAIEKSEPLEGDLSGTFTWGGVTYTVTFEQVPDQPDVVA